MTSIPASRSERAMIFAPRSCPSRPGLATTTRILRWVGVADMERRPKGGGIVPPVARRRVPTTVPPGRRRPRGLVPAAAGTLPAMAEIEVGDVVLARGATGRFHAVVTGVRLGR